MSKISNDDRSATGKPNQRHTETRERLRAPSRYDVVMMNDDFTPMDFVIQTLQRHFGKVESEAYNIMMEVHVAGSAICGTYSFEIAETKIDEVMKEARHNQFPLKCAMRKS